MILRINQSYKRNNKNEILCLCFICLCYKHTLSSLLHPHPSHVFPQHTCFTFGLCFGLWPVNGACGLSFGLRACACACAPVPVEVRLCVEHHHVFKNLGFPWSSQENHHR